MVLTGGATQSAFENVDPAYDSKLFTKTVEMENLRKSHTAASWFNREKSSRAQTTALNADGKINRSLFTVDYTS